MPVRHGKALTLALGLGLLSASPAEACRIRASFVAEDVRLAELVVIGRIANYRIVLDEDGARQRRKILERTDLDPSLRASLEAAQGSLWDYARFDILVDQVLVGKAGAKLTATWDNSTFPEPASMPPGEYLIALRYAASPAPPLRGPSATLAPNREPALPTVLQAPCAGAFVLPVGSREAIDVRTVIALDKSLSEYRDAPLR